ncbi:MAG: hypothetical protein OHK0013_23940 [Sandaracinaceae bacterium]
MTGALNKGARADEVAQPLAGLAPLVSTVRSALVLRGALESTVLAATTLGAASLVSALVSPSWPRWPFVALLPLAPLVGVWRARRSLPDEADVVLWIDRRLDGGESIVAAYELHAARREAPLFTGTIASAEARLAGARPTMVRPRVVRGDAWGLVMAAATFLAASVVPVPPPRALAPGADVVQSTETEGLERIERLPERATEELERRRLEEAAAQARELREALAAGLERREALDRVESLRQTLETARDASEAERERAQQDAAEALAEEAEMAEAVRQRDLDALARAAERAASRREAADRERARRALEDAARAAREAGDEALAESLLESEALLAHRAEQAALARELMASMPELAELGMGRALDRLARDGDGTELDRAMVDAAREAWGRLSQEERERLARALRDAPLMENGGGATQQGGEGAPMTADELERQLREALEHLDDLQVQLGQGMPVPQRGQGQGRGQGHSTPLVGRTSGFGFEDPAGSHGRRREAGRSCCRNDPEHAGSRRGHARGCIAGRDLVIVFSRFR